jgi:hypothetical protein
MIFALFNNCLATSAKRLNGGVCIGSALSPCLVFDD